MPQEKIGLECKLYVSDGQATPAWVEVGSARTVTPSHIKNQIDTSRRGNKYRAWRGGLKDFEVVTELIKDTTDNGYNILSTAWDGDTEVEILVMDGPEDAAAGASVGYQSFMWVTDFSEAQPLEDVVTINCRLNNSSKDDPTAVSSPAGTPTAP